MFQSRKQDYFNWKNDRLNNLEKAIASFSPASRIILIERLLTVNVILRMYLFQSRKQDYFNWKVNLQNRLLMDKDVSVPQAGLF